jgi:hypothetical protein
MLRMRTWIASLHRGQLLMLLSVLVLGSCGTGLATFFRWSADRRACATATEFSDSLASNSSRLAAVDEVLARFDLATRALPDSAFAGKNGAPNRLERRIIALRMEGATAPQIERWITHDVRLDRERPTDGPSLATAADSSRRYMRTRRTPRTSIICTRRCRSRPTIGTT